MTDHPFRWSSRVALMTALTLASAAARLTAQDTSFAAMQARGKVAMGVDQQTAVHRFDDMKDGGRIRLHDGTQGGLEPAVVASASALRLSSTDVLCRRSIDLDGHPWSVCGLGKTGAYRHG